MIFYELFIYIYIIYNYNIVVCECLCCFVVSCCVCVKCLLLCVCEVFAGVWLACPCCRPYYQWERGQLGSFSNW